MLISKVGHQVNKENITSVAKWDLPRGEYVGSATYSIDGKLYLNPITESELAELISMGFAPECLESKYSDTY